MITINFNRFFNSYISLLLADELRGGGLIFNDSVCRGGDGMTLFKRGLLLSYSEVYKIKRCCVVSVCVLLFA